MSENKEKEMMYRHSMSHVLAKAIKELYGKDLPGGKSTFTVRFEVKNVAELEAIRTKLLNIRDVVGSRRGQS